MKTRYYKSFASNGSHYVSEDQFTLSLLRDPNSDNLDEASLVIEGMNQFGRAYLRKYDYLQNQNNLCAKIRIIEIPNIELADVGTIFASNLLEHKEYYSQSFDISKKSADILHENILKEQLNPPRYHRNPKGNDRTLQSDAEDLNFGDTCLEWSIKHIKNIRKFDISYLNSDLQQFKVGSSHLNGIAKPLACCIL